MARLAVVASSSRGLQLLRVGMELGVRMAKGPFRCWLRVSLRRIEQVVSSNLPPWELGYIGGVNPVRGMEWNGPGIGRSFERLVRTSGML